MQEDKQFVDGYSILAKKDYEPWLSWCLNRPKMKPRSQPRCTCGIKLKTRDAYSIGFPGEEVWYCPKCG